MRPGQQAEDDSEKSQSEIDKATQSDFLMSFQNFVLYPEKSLENVMYFARDTGNADTYIN